MALIEMDFAAGIGGGIDIMNPSYVYHIRSISYNSTWSISNVPTDAKYFLCSYIRSGGNTTVVLGDIKNQALKANTLNADGEVVLVDSTWSDYVTSISSGTITFTGKISRDTGGAGFADVCFWS